MSPIKKSFSPEWETPVPQGRKGQASVFQVLTAPEAGLLRTARPVWIFLNPAGVGKWEQMKMFDQTPKATASNNGDAVLFRPAQPVA